MEEIMTDGECKVQLCEQVKKLNPKSNGKEFEDRTQGFPIKSAQIHKISSKMVEIRNHERGKVQLSEQVKKLIPESNGKEIEKQTLGIFPMMGIFPMKVETKKKGKA
eukprot:10797983-Heterocapsa_arctica.AAC.1